MNDELKNCGRNWWWRPFLRYYPSIYGLRKTTKTFSQDTRSESRDSYPALPVTKQTWRPLDRDVRFY
jgi:DNA topoisomerase IB